MEDEIDLAQYVNTVFKYWKLVLGIALAAVVIAGIVSFATPPVYEATALLQAINSKNQEQMFELAKSDSTARFMLRSLSDNLTPGERNLTTIKSLFKVETGEAYFTCTVRYPSAQRAADLANAWAAAFIKYSTDMSLKALTPPEEMRAQIASSYAFYQEAQGSFESFQLTSQASEINRQIADANLLYQALQLQDSMRKGQGEAISDEATSLAFLLIKLKAYASISDSTPITSGTATPVTQADVNALVRELENRSGIHDKTANEILMEINSMQARLEQESQRSKELAGSRDTAWSSYLDAVKTAETLNIQRSVLVAPVRLVDSAMPPSNPVPTSRWTNIAIALVLGLILGVIAAFVAEYIERRRPAPPSKQSTDNKTQQE
ncbi:MAG: Wzz/FepE/Etk N-terminal domain-containing protein [Dehalococcoidia bacterium]